MVSLLLLLWGGVRRRFQCAASAAGSVCTATAKGKEEGGGIVPIFRNSGDNLAFFTIGDGEKEISAPIPHPLSCFAISNKKTGRKGNRRRRKLVYCPGGGRGETEEVRFYCGGGGEGGIISRAGEACKFHLGRGFPSSSCELLLFFGIATQ